MDGRYDGNLPDRHFGQFVELWTEFLADGGSINSADKAGNTPLQTYLSSQERDQLSSQDSWEKSPSECHLDHYQTPFSRKSKVDIFLQ
jgi:hypothetical protein